MPLFLNTTTSLLLYRAIPTFFSVPRVFPFLVLIIQFQTSLCYNNRGIGRSKRTYPTPVSISYTKLKTKSITKRETKVGKSRQLVRNMPLPFTSSPSSGPSTKKP
ncbi:hypothetical protein QBC45DRAFT_406425 [Copromyces sp. CBS 386.78]|nr:hypothetical protein QBC45DRAFT_406425 [Copromyces sp. CBS 386.78]